MTDSPSRPPSVKDIIQRRRPVRDVNKEQAASIGPLESLAVFINDRVGTPGFFFLIILWTVVWLGWNLLAPPSLKFDPPMGFVFWLFISNCLQIFLMPLLMVAQNLQSRHDELRAESDLETNIKAEHEIEAVLKHLEYQNELLEALIDKQGLTVDQVLAALKSSKAAAETKPAE